MLNRWKAFKNLVFKIFTYFCFMITPKKHTTVERNESIRQSFYQLYEVERIRRDDVIMILAKNFYLTERRICEILRIDPNEKSNTL